MIKKEPKNQDFIRFCKNLQWLSADAMNSQVYIFLLKQHGVPHMPLKKVKIILIMSKIFVHFFSAPFEIHFDFYAK